MKIKTITTYAFSELSEKAQEKALEKNFDCNTFYDWWDDTYEDAKTIGLKITGFNIDRERDAQGDFIESPAHVATLIRANHGPDTGTFGSAFCFAMELERQAIAIEEKTKADPEYDPELDLVLEIRRSDCEKWFLQQLLEDYSIMLQKEFEFQTSKEAIIGTFEADDYQFLENGERA